LKEKERLTIGLSLGQDFGQVHGGFTDEIRFPRVIRIAAENHSLATFDSIWETCSLWRRRRGCTSSVGGLHLGVFVFVQRETDLFVPFRMLATAFYSPCSSFLAIQSDDTVWILLSDMPFIRKMSLEKSVRKENEHKGDLEILYGFQEDYNEGSDFSGSRGH
jgi:hypothetical protein